MQNRSGYLFRIHRWVVFWRAILHNGEMVIRPAHVDDATRICEIVNHYAERSLMLHRSLESVYAGLREFFVAEDDAGLVIGCVAMEIYWRDLAEIRSLAVAPEIQRSGAGKALIGACLDDAKRLGVTRVFAMTYENDYFRKLGFSEVALDSLPEKIWRECLEWYNQGHRHETAMIVTLP